MTSLINNDTQSEITQGPDTISNELPCEKTSSDKPLFDIMGILTPEDKLINEKLENEIMEKDGKIGIVINESYGGFGINDNAIHELNARGFRISKKGYGDRPQVTFSRGIKRTCKELIKLIEEGKDVNEEYAHLGVEYIDKKYFLGPGFWVIEEYDGKESIDIDDFAFDMWDRLRALELIHKNVYDLMDQSADPKAMFDKIKTIYQENTNLLTNCTKYQ